MNGTTGAIFIPCRGGGTATTYYTDDHNVDEDATTDIVCGGDWGTWWPNPMGGVTARDMASDHSSTKSRDNVASLKK